MDAEGLPRTDAVWLLNLGYVSEHSEQNLLLYGYISSPGVMNVELLINVEKNTIQYAIILEAKAYRKYLFQRWLERKCGLLHKIALFYFLRMFGSYDPAVRITRCVRDYAGPSWKTSTEVLDVKRYIERTHEGGTKGWIFQNGLTEGAGTPG